MISEENRIAFIHIPRNGGISVMNALNIQIPEEVEYDDIKTIQNKEINEVKVEFSSRLSGAESTPG